MNTESVAVVILNWRGLEDTRACCKSLRRVRGGFRCVVVDNASGDGSATALAREFPEFAHVANSENLGFAAGNNQAIERALKDGAEYIILLNNDTEVAPDFLDHLLNSAAADDKVGIVGPKIYFYDEPALLWYGGGQFGANERCFFAHRGYGEPDGEEYSRAGETDFVTGCCMLIKAQVIRDIGMLDERFGYYCEDVDFCLRAKQAGWTSYFEPRAKVWHKVSRSTRRANLRLEYYNDRNTILVVRRYFPAGAGVKLSWNLFWKAWWSPFWAVDEKTAQISGVLDGVMKRQYLVDPTRGRHIAGALARLSILSLSIRERIRRHMRLGGGRK